MSINSLPSRKLAASSHLKIQWLEDDPASFWGPAYFQGRTASFREGKYWKVQLPVANISGNWMICGVFSLRSHDCHDPIY